MRFAPRRPVSPHARGPGDVRIVLATAEHVEALGALERAAATRFHPCDVPATVAERTTPHETLARAAREGRLWIALGSSEAPVGFALAERDPDAVYLAELDVLPDHGRRGIGRALVAAVCAWARAQGAPAVTLTTFSHVPWNAPFYERLGFRAIPPEALPETLRARLAEQARDGLDPARRIAMRLLLATPPGRSASD